MLGAEVRTFAVDDHAAGQNEPAPELTSPQRLQQGRSSHVVGLYIARPIVEVETETELRRLVTYRIHAGDGSGCNAGVTQVTDDKFGPLVDPVGTVGVLTTDVKDANMDAQ